MTQLDTLLSQLRERAISLWVDEGRLRYRAPAGALDGDLAARVRERKSEIIEFLLRADAPAAARDRIPIIPRDGELPLSIGQERIWFVQMMDPASVVYNQTTSLRLRGPLDLPAIRHALAAVWERHEVLRSRFPAEDGRPRLELIEGPPPECVVQDLGRPSIEEALARAEQRVNEQAREPLDLHAGPLVRHLLLRVDAEDHVLAVTIHHIIADGWSFHEFFRDLNAFYRSFALGERLALDPLRVQYVDFSAWQRAKLAEGKLDDHLGYWRERLDGAPEALKLPYDRAPHPSAPRASGYLFFVLREDLAAALRNFSVREGVTLFITLFSAFQALLHRYSGQQDLLVCSPVAARTHVELEPLVGYFNNLVLMRTLIPPSAGFRDLLEYVREAALGAYAAQEVPLQDVAQLPSLSGVPCARAMFALQNTPAGGLEMGGIEISRFARPMNGVSDFEFSLSMRDRGDALTGLIDYRAALFDHETIEEVERNLTSILESIVRDPDLPVAQLPGHFEIEGRARAAENAVVEVRRSRSLSALDPREEILAQLWRESLGVEDVDPYDNFFDLGGQSLLGLTCISRYFEVTGKRIRPQELVTETLRQIVSGATGVSPDVTVASAPREPALEPFYFGEAGALFGAFHPPLPGVKPMLPALLCQPIGQEYIRSHRAFQQLARRLARRGHPVLRFDYRATGDSLGECEQGGPAIWIDDILTALAELRRRTGSDHGVLIGCRMGATLAALAAQQSDAVSGLVLWHAVEHGAQYLRELGETHESRVVPFREGRAPVDEAREVLGFSLGPECCDGLREIDLERELRRAPAARAFVIASEDRKVSEALPEQLRGLGCQVATHLVDEQGIWMKNEEIDKGVVPVDTLEAIVRWVGASQ